MANNKTFAPTLAASALVFTGSYAAVQTFVPSSTTSNLRASNIGRGQSWSKADASSSASLLPAAAGVAFAAVAAAAGRRSTTARRAVPNTPNGEADMLAGNRTEASKVSRPYDTFNPNYPLSSPDQPRTEVSSEDIPRPETLTVDNAKFPLFGGSAGGYMSKATRERHAITWTGKDELKFEMPTGGVAVMNKGENLCYFRKKEQCIAVCKQLRNMKINDVKIYRLAKDGTVTFLHPSDGVYPEKVNKGRVPVNFRPFTVCQNAAPMQLNDTPYFDKPYEADPLTTLFVQARTMGYYDIPNLFKSADPEAPGIKELSKEAMESQKKRIEAAVSGVQKSL